jgi:hypothetical protein
MFDAGRLDSSLGLIDSRFDLLVYHRKVSLDQVTCSVGKVQLGEFEGS